MSLGGYLPVMNHASEDEMRNSIREVRKRLMGRAKPQKPVKNVVQRIVWIRPSQDAHIAAYEAHKALSERLCKLHNQSKSDVPAKIKVIDIARACAEHYRVSLIDILSERRTLDIRIPRFAAMYLAKVMTPFSTPRIGNAFNRDHTTVLHAIKRMEKMMADDPKIAADVAAIRARLA